MQKSGNVKLRITNKHQWGKTVILPTAGETKIGNDGIFEIEDAVATILLRNTSHYTLVEGNGTTVTAEIYPEDVDEESTDYVAEDEETEDEDEDDSEDEDSDEDSDDEDGDDSDEDDSEGSDEDEDDSDEDEEEEDEDDGLDDKKLGELIEIAEKAEIPGDDYKKFKKSKKLMVNFLRKYDAE